MNQAKTEENKIAKDVPQSTPAKTTGNTSGNSVVNELEQEKDKLMGTKTGKKPLSNDEIISGLKEALTVGTNNSTASASKSDGYFMNPNIKIPFPPQAAQIKTTLVDFGMQSQVDKFELSINRAAEEAAKGAAPIFINAVTGMTITDGLSILKGADNAATKYLTDKTSAQLHDLFKPTVKNAIAKVEVTKYWNPLITKYNKIPGVDKQNPDLEEYVTQKALEGLYKLLADEEKKIRKDPAAQVTDLLKKVFGSL